MVAKIAAAQMATVVGGSTFSTRAASCSASGEAVSWSAVTGPFYPANRLDRITPPSSPIGSTPAVDPHIGTLNEGSLHAALKDHYAQPGDRFEVPLRRFVIDIARRWEEPGELFIEIQTSSFGSMGNKLDHILGEHRVLLVHPIAVRTRLERDGNKPRWSPKRGSIYSLFEELVSMPTLLDHPNLALDIVLVEVTKRQEHDPRARRGRGGWRTVDRRLEAIVETHRFDDVSDLTTLLPDNLPPTFTTADLAASGQMSRDEAQRLAYCFRAANLFDQVGRTRKGIEYRLSS